MTYRFPKDKDRGSSWATCIGRHNWVPKPQNRICSDHFKEKDIDRSNDRVQIKHRAYPTQFKERSKNSHHFDHDYCVPQLDREQLATKHTYANPDSPRTTEKKLKNNINILKNKKKGKQQLIRRLKKKVMSLRSLLKNLKDKSLISSSCEEHMFRKFSGVSVDILKRAITTKRGKKGKCSPELKAFAMTLQFYSKKAYEYVRQTFDLALPHQGVLTKWYSKERILKLI